MSPPGAAQKSIQCVDNADVFTRKRHDRGADGIIRNIRDLKWGKNDPAVADHKSKPDVTLATLNASASTSGTITRRAELLNRLD